MSGYHLLADQVTNSIPLIAMKTSPCRSKNIYLNKEMLKDVICINEIVSSRKESFFQIYAIHGT